MAWHVYIAQAPTGRYYTGITTDPTRRIQEHNRDEGAKFNREMDRSTSKEVDLKDDDLEPDF